jgi:hypothetical protein
MVQSLREYLENPTNDIKDVINSSLATIDVKGIRAINSTLNNSSNILYN